MSSRARDFWSQRDRLGERSDERATQASEDDRRGFILIVISFLSAILVIAGLFYAMGTGARHKTALAAADCEPSLSPSGLPCTTEQMLTSQFNGDRDPGQQATER